MLSLLTHIMNLMTFGVLYYISASASVPSVCESHRATEFPFINGRNGTARAFSLRNDGLRCALPARRNAPIRPKKSDSYTKPTVFQWNNIAT